MIRIWPMFGSVCMFILCLLESHASTDCNTKMEDRLELYTFDQFGYETGLFETGGKVEVRYKTTGATLVPLKKINGGGGATIVGNSSKTGCLSHPLRIATVNFGNYFVDYKQFSIKYRLCSYTESWQCKVNELCYVTVNNLTKPHCDKFDDTLGLGKITEIGELCPKFMAGQYIQACPKTTCTGLPACQYCRQLFENIPTNTLTLADNGKCDDYEISISGETKHKTYEAVFNNGSTVKLNKKLTVAVGYSATWKIKTDGKVFASMTFKKLESRFDGLNGSEFKENAIYHARFAIERKPRDDLKQRQYVDYIFAKLTVNINTNQTLKDDKNGCSLIDDKFKCTAELKNHQSGLRIAAKLDKANGQDIETWINNLKETDWKKKKAISADVKPAKSSTEYVCMVAVAFRLTTDRVRQVIVYKKSTPAKFSCEPGKYTNGSDVVKPTSPSPEGPSTSGGGGGGGDVTRSGDVTNDPTRTLVPNNRGRSGEHGLYDKDDEADSNKTAIIAVSAVLVLIVVVIVIAVLLYFMVFKKRRTQNPASVQAKTAETDAARLAKLVARMHAEDEYCMFPEDIQAYRVAKREKNFEHSDFTTINSVIKLTWAHFTDKKLSVMKAEMTQAGKWGYMTQAVRWRAEPLIKATAVPDLDGNVPSTTSTANQPVTPQFKAIHANYVPGIFNDRRYVASQAPLELEFDMAMQIWMREKVKVVIAIGTDTEISVDFDPNCKMSAYFREADETRTHKFGEMSLRLVRKLIDNEQMEVRMLEIFRTGAEKDSKATSAATSGDSGNRSKSAEKSKKEGKPPGDPKKKSKDSGKSKESKKSTKPEAAKSTLNSSNNEEKGKSKSKQGTAGGKEKTPDASIDAGLGLGQSISSISREAAGADKPDKDPKDKKRGSLRDKSKRGKLKKGKEDERKKGKKSDKHVFCHIVYKAWKDQKDLQGQVKHILAIYRLLHTNTNVKDMLAESNAKILVHCSAGRGRTGTLILALNALNLCTEKIEPINFRVLLSDLRECRYGAVTTEEQFGTAVESIAELQDEKDKSMSELNV